MKPLRPAFSTGLGAVYKTDCMRLFAALRDGCIDTVFADPPFNLGKDYGNGKDKDEWAEDDHYLSWCHSWLSEAVRVLKPGGSLFIYNLPRWSYHLAAYLERQQDMDFRHWIAVSMKGTFPRGKKLYPAHYALLYFTKGTPTTFNRDAVRMPVPVCRHCGGDIKDYGGHKKYLNELGLNLCDLWDDTSPARHSKFKARWGINELKPVIPERCIKLTTNPRDIVLDPFGGGGSTYEAAETLGRHWIGTEIVDCSLIRERFERNLPQVYPATPIWLANLLKEPNPQLRIAPLRCPELLTKSGTTEPNRGLNGSGSHPSSKNSKKSLKVSRSVSLKKSTATAGQLSES